MDAWLVHGLTSDFRLNLCIRKVHFLNSSLVIRASVGLSSTLSLIPAAGFGSRQWPTPLTLSLPWPLKRPYVTGMVTRIGPTDFCYLPHLMILITVLSPVCMPFRTGCPRGWGRVAAIVTWESQTFTGYHRVFFQFPRCSPNCIFHFFLLSSFFFSFSTYSTYGFVNLSDLSAYLDSTPV